MSLGRKHLQIPTNQQLPDVDLRVPHLDEELEHIGVEAQGGQVYHIVSITVHLHQVGAHVE